MSGSLFLVGTPIGNLEDMSARGLRALAEADHILAEDTRHSIRLLRHFGINTPLTAWHAHNEHAKLDTVLGWLEEGQSIALVSDAGMPLISDPGFPLVRAVREAGYQLECVPGPTALVTALVLSGFPADRFVFEGFLPAKAAARRENLQSVRNETRTVIFYESPHRLGACLEDMQTVLGPDRMICLARELTKRFESVRTGTIGSMVEWVQNPGDEGRGEFVLLIQGQDLPQEANALDAEQVMAHLLTELPARKAAKLTAKLCGGKANTYYEWSLRRDGHAGEVE